MNQRPYCTFCGRFVDTYEAQEADANEIYHLVDTGKCSICMNPTEQRAFPEVENKV